MTVTATAVPQHTHTYGSNRWWPSTGKRDKDTAISTDALNFVISQVKKVNAILDYQDQTISIRRVALRESLACYNHIEWKHDRPSCGALGHFGKWCEARERVRKRRTKR